MFKENDIFRNAPLLVVDIPPGATVPMGVCAGRSVLSVTRAVLDPVARDLLEGRLSTDNDGQAGILGKGDAGVRLRDLGNHVLVADHNKVPWD